MINAQRYRSGVRLLAFGCLLSFVAFTLLASSVRAAGFGELTRFGESPTDGGEAGPGQLSEADNLAIGVDPTNNSVYVLEERLPSKEKAKMLTRFLRLKKFAASAEGQYAETASASFEEVSPAVKEGEENLRAEPGVDGIAVDPGLGRVYLLTADLRESKLKKDTLNFQNHGLIAAGRLYDFSTKEEGSKLVPAVKGSKEEGVLDGPTELGTQSETTGAALLEPHGITVDPATHEVLILAHIDTAGAAARDSFKSEGDHFVLQRINDEGKLEERYEDKTNVLKQQGELDYLPVPTSPVVASAGGTEHVYVSFDGLAEIPYKSSTAPKLLPLAANPQSSESIEPGIAETESGVPPEEREPRLAQGGLLSASPEGTLFGMVNEIKDEEAGGGLIHEGVLALSGENGAVIGWTGGQQSKGTTLADNRCVISPGIKGLPAQVAAGSGGKVFVLAPEFLHRLFEEEITEIVINEEGEEEEIVVGFKLEPLVGAVPQGGVVEFGPGGEGCQPASATGPVAKVNGTEIKGEETVRPGSEVSFTSLVKQADAMQVEWTFENEAGVKETAKQEFKELQKAPPSETRAYYRAPSITHKFAAAGRYKITEVITEDDLAASALVYTAGQLSSPTITLVRSLNVGLTAPTAQFSGPAALTAGETASFESLSTDPNGKTALPLEYVWNFGDGSSATAPSPSPSTSHVYGAPGNYTVTLTVTDHLGLTGTTSHTLTVAAPVQQTQTQTQTTGTTTTPVVTGEVLSYKASLASSSLSVSKSGAVSLKVDCGGRSSCAGSVTLKTLKAVASKHKRKAILVLAKASFSLAGGQVKVLTLHLSAAARALLAHTHTLKVRAVILARDSSGHMHTTSSVVTLRIIRRK